MYNQERHKYSHEAQMLVCNEYKSGLSARQVAEKYGIEKSLVYKMLKRHNVPLHTKVNEIKELIPNTPDVLFSVSPDKVGNLDHSNNTSEPTPNTPTQQLLETLVRNHARGLIMQMLMDIETKEIK